MNYGLIFTLAFAVSACSESAAPPVDAADSPVADTIAEVKVLPIEARLCGPMLGLANYLDTLGYVDDSTRLRTVYTFLNDNPRLYGRGHTFYQCMPGETCMMDLIVIGNLPTTFDTLIFTNQTVIEYFFTTPTKDEAGWYIDGIVEQWKFEDSVQARAAACAIALDSNISVHNAPLMVCYVNDCMYVFHSRGTPAMYTIKPYFLDFVKENEAVVVSR